ncbi:DUF3139 domain-containing protein [Brevibacillus marinus]|uniref:DUF3139 domain-containing protein n=1 Tax=Brevibacillus marinus TaxID=2496837 RepID=UPI000F81FBE0|nr:DUF3139 domain-containing protein [Brevibacillus marinus]
MKRLVFVLLLLFIVSPLMVYGEWIVGGYPWVKNQMEMEVRAHLASRGYKPADIQDVKADYNRKLSGYTTKVIFRDEKNSIYYYDYINGNIVQTGLTTSDRDNAKHIEKDSFQLR